MDFRVDPTMIAPPSLHFLTPCARHAGKYLELQFDLGGGVVGGRVTNFLLEKSRVVRAWRAPPQGTGQAPFLS